VYLKFLKNRNNSLNTNNKYFSSLWLV